MTVLVADVGGTNTRLALGSGGRLIADTLVRLRNDDHASFDAALDGYLAGRPAPAAMCIAIAGPVTDGAAGATGRLTNRDWGFDSAALTARTGARVRLINDLTALGFALGGLAGDGLLPVWTPPADAVRGINGQALVLGLGTGANVCAVKAGPQGALCLEAEAGHTALPTPVAAALAARLGSADAFPTVEALFAGRGLARLHAGLTGAAMTGDRIVAEAATDAAAAATLALFAGMLGTYARDLALTFMPRAGLYLAGSVARGVVGTAADAFRAAFTADAPFAAIPRGIPVRIIADDMAALTGCLAALGDG
ncbi:MAG: glucokinase [Gemmobacter sp.]